ncbi:MAG: glycosyltransferase [Chloroflexota bacterium]|nr:MAG: glycosyltransferase [Chloroflexota bacterium]
MNIVFISPIAWDNSGGAHRPVQFAQELAARKHSVTYIEIEKSRARASANNPRVVTLEDLGWDELNLVRAWYGFDYTSPADLDARLRQFTPLGNARGIAICCAPFRPALQVAHALAAQGYTLVYDVLDDISEMRALGSYCYDELAENYLAQHSELIVTLSPRLREKFSKYKNVKLIRDGVDLAPFQNDSITQNADSLERGELTLGFWGTMWDYNLDVPLIQFITRARPQWQFHFIGAYDLDPARPLLSQALAAPNVHFHSSIARETLAHYARSFDVCLLPTPVTPFNLARDPLKVYEYLACHKPVVATNLEQLADMPYVYRACDAQDFLFQIEQAARVEIESIALNAYLAEQTWVKRTNQLLNALDELTPSTRTLPPAPHGAMPNAAKELDRWQAYAQHLERLAHDREIHVRDLENALAQSSVANKLKRVLSGQ